MDLRNRFSSLMSEGMTAAAAGCVLRLSRATAARWGRKYRNGESPEPGRRGARARKGNGKLEPFVVFFVELMEQDCDITLAEMQAALFEAHNVKCSPSGIDVLLRRHGDSYKKRTGGRGAQ